MNRMKATTAIITASVSTPASKPSTISYYKERKEEIKEGRRKERKEVITIALI
jgi:hypothetical protein